jgi:hypothetical protein
MSQTIRTVKVFSATRLRDRDALGERVTLWIRSHPEETILRTTVLQSSDESFHCLSIVLICGSPS